MRPQYLQSTFRRTAECSLLSYEIRSKRTNSCTVRLTTKSSGSNVSGRACDYIKSTGSEAEAIVDACSYYDGVLHGTTRSKCIGSKRPWIASPSPRATYSCEVTAAGSLNYITPCSWAANDVFATDKHRPKERISNGASSDRWCSAVATSRCD